MGSATYTGGSHLKFRKLPLKKGLKLHRYKVTNTKFYQDIGIIHWRGGWRQYVFRAEPEVDMSRSCYKEIDKFIDKLMEQWKRSKKGRAGK
ncbi:MAG TPA: hypothetical protein ENI23_14650 [bacterium]|nr:hypothetical protein [bacterium]